MTDKILTLQRVKASTPHCRPFHRIHTRVLARNGRQIPYFTFIPTRLRAFHVAIQEQRSLYVNGMPYCDISNNSILITFLDQHRPDGLTEFMIDLDVAIGAFETEPAPDRMEGVNRYLWTFVHY